MLTKVINWAVDYRWLVVLCSMGIAIAGYVGLTKLNIDAFPDTTPYKYKSIRLLRPWWLPKSSA